MREFNYVSGILDELAERYLMKVKYKRLGGKIDTPKVGDAGFDLYSTEDIRIIKGGIAKVPLGIATELPFGVVGIIKDRSGKALEGLKIAGGVIDSTYRGEWQAIIVNLSGEDKVIHKGTKICQVIFLPYIHILLEESELSDSLRGDKGFGSSG